MSSEYGVWHKELRAWARIKDLKTSQFLCELERPEHPDTMLLECFAVFNQYEDAQEWLCASGHTQYEIRRFY